MINKTDMFNPYRLFLLIAGIFSICLSTLVLIGWHIQNPVLVQIHPTFAPMQYNAALIFMLLGFGYIFFVFKLKQLARVCASLVFLISFLNILEYIFHIDLGIDQFFIHPFITTKTSNPGRLAPNTSLCLILISLALGLMSGPKRILHKAFTASILLSISISLALVAIWGYLTGIESAYGWSSFTRMALHAAFLIILLGVGLWLYVTSLVTRNNKLLMWFPFHLALMLILVTICLWQALIAQENVYLRQLSGAEAKHVKIVMEGKLKDIQETLLYLIQDWQSKETPEQEMDQEIASYLSKQLGLVMAIRFNSQLEEQPPQMSYLSHLTLLKKSLKTKLDKYIQSGEAGDGIFMQNKQLIFWSPIFFNQQLEGLLVEIFNIKELFDLVLKDILEDFYNIEILDNQQVIYGNTLSGPPPNGYGQAFLDFVKMPWEIRIWPTPLLLQEEKTHLPLVTLLGGIFIAFVSSLASYLFQLTKLRKGELEQALNKLYISTRQNETILNSMSEGVLGLTSIGRVEFANQPALRMLGYQNNPEFMGSQISLILNCPNIFSQFEGTFNRKDGSSFSVEYSSTSLQKEDGSEGYIIVFRDVTKQQEAKKEAQKALNLFKTVINNARLIIYVKDLSFSYLTVNKAFLDLFNLTEEEVLEKNDYDFFAKTNADRIRKYDQKVFLTKEALKIEEVIPTINGEHTYISVKFPLFDDKGKIYALCGISTDITEIKEAEIKLKAYLHQVESTNKELEIVNRELMMSRQMAEKANNAKSSFLANMSHEIRTPLNVIIGLTSLLLKTHLDEKQHDYLSRMHLSGKLLNELINDILDYSKIETGELTLEEVPADIVKIVKEIRELFYIKAEEKKFEILVEISPPSFPEVLVDIFRLRQILVNLISNAIKFTMEGHILIKLNSIKQTEQNITLRFEITDTGIGISPENQKLLFEKFFQVDTSLSKKFRGTGLGLAISKHLVELMGGKIGCRSEEKKGSTFWFEIPFKLSLKEKSDFISLAAKRKQLREKSFLIVSDQIDGHGLENYMENWGVQYQACNSEEALKILESPQKDQKRFDFVFIDYTTQNLNALEVGKKIKINPSYQDLHIILLTSNELKGQLDPYDYKDCAILTTPIHPLELFYLVINYL